MKRTTKADLEREMAELRDSLVVVRKELESAKSNARMKADECSRLSLNNGDLSSRLVSICSVIRAVLVSKHSATVSDEISYGAPKENDVGEDVRLLRHLYEIADIRVPF